MFNVLQSIFYDTDQFKFDCLHYYSTGDSLSPIVKYCVRPNNESNYTMIDPLKISDQYLTFNDLYHLNISSDEILLRTLSINLAETYQFYLDSPIQSNLSNEIFFNCTKPWFGSYCQYSFEFNQNELITNTIEQTCYILLECNRNNPSICLDWREICNGRIECLNNGIDEIECFNLEINECEENEYRCHIGLCIPKIFLDMEFVGVQCLDRSDEIIRENSFSSNYLSYEEYVCQPGEGQFSCGDGNCVEDFHECENNRHLRLFQSISEQKNLSYSCWIVMVCLSKILDQIENRSCDHFMELLKIIEDFQKCHFPLKFPEIPVLFGHIQFLYSRKTIHNFNRTFILKPDYVCYDAQLCDFLEPSFHWENLTCRYGNETGLESNIELTTWKSLIDSIKPYFIGCKTQHHQSINSSHYSSLYHCQNSSKYISKSRLIDGIYDCFLKDDEQVFQLSCSLNQTFRFQCSNETQCYSPLISRNICSSIPINSNEILFYEICNRIIDLPLILINGQYHSDETDCQYWQCNNIYTRCDGFENCLDGKDEINCTEPIILNYFLFCILPENSSLMCLPVNHVNDGMIDCCRVLSNDYRYVQMNNITLETYKYRYWNNTECIEDEDCFVYEKFLELCVDHSQLSNDDDLNNLSNIQNALCRTITTRDISFSLETALVYPPLPDIHINSDENQVDTEMRELFFQNSIQSNPCNYGLHVYHRFSIDNFNSLCFCPPNYYGDRCQYQNQRVSITLVLATVNQSTIYAIIVTLMEDDNDRQEIHSYHQFIYQSKKYCGKPIDIYLLFAKRDKDISKKYNIRIDVFDKNSLIYIISWYLKIPFIFLPVNRVTAFLTLPISRTINSIHCTLQCLNGICIKYQNEERFFCKCYSGWSGARCHIPIDCSMCASNSICISSIQNQPICICPQNRFGSFCRLKLTCPKEHCQNNGQCIVIDERRINDSYVCLCSEQFSGPLCEYQNYRIEISLKNMKIPSYLLIHIYNGISFEQLKPTYTILKKISMFQTDILLYTEHIFQMILVKTSKYYYLAALQTVELSNLTTSISDAQRCPSIDELFNKKLLSMPRIYQLKSYHLLCQHNLNLQCFIDEFYMCLCTREHHSNCFQLDHQMNFLCKDNVYCENDGTCLQDRPICFHGILCLCPDCFFGDRCQFYAKGIGLTLDDLLRYEIRPNRTLNDQSLAVKLNATFLMILFLIGLLNSFLSYLVFENYNSRKVGSGIYLRLSSIISSVIVCILIMKFWFVIYTYMNPSMNRQIVRIGCILLEPILRLFVHMSNWLNTCVAIERAIAVYQGIYFNKKRSRCIARWIIYFLPFLILSSMSYEFIHRDLFDDNEERRVWCVIRYSQSIEWYTRIVQYFHFVVPFLANFFSALFIIVNITRQRMIIRTHFSYKQQLLNQINEHKQLVVSPIVLIILLFPRFLVSLLSKCVKSTQNPWLYLCGYFIAFIPSSFIFIIYVLPSTFYRKQFKQSIITWRQRFRETVK
ncbi:unnamed protein product [Adineta ricciae]|uniref:Uncharacterized protein n=1 Tax=Adineta ricciae TaxID=249248 RepID=A0A815W6Y0_ADIRI|nr:unnamed protein product [Adineta ricciae]